MFGYRSNNSLTMLLSLHKSRPTLTQYPTLHPFRPFPISMNQILTAAGILLGGIFAFCQPIIHAAETAADLIAITMADERIATAVNANAIDSPGQVVVVYFTPKDRQPAAQHVSRIGRIVEASTGFYERELQRHGFKQRRMNVMRDEQGDPILVDVVGANNDKDYDKPDGRKIRDEVIPVLRSRGINPDSSVILLFCNLMDYDPVASKISHHSPYYGGGSHLAGTAWQCDSEILDPLRLTDSTSLHDGQYGHITIGRHNSIFIGGVIHELGHALSLPHCRQRQDEAHLGTALMGTGNHTFGQQLRGEGRGTFLTQASALRLAAHPVFNRRVTGHIFDQPQMTWNDLVIDVADDQTVRIKGQVKSDIAVHGVVAYFDPAGGNDYDATTATAVPDNMGRFSLRSEPLKPGSSAELRLVACHVNGATSYRSFAFRVDAEGYPDVSAIRLELELSPLLEALREDRLTAAEIHLKELAEKDPSLLPIGQRVISRFRDSASAAAVELERVDLSRKSLTLSQVKPISAKVGWKRPTYDRVPSDEKLLSVDGDYFASGIYAHAPAEHAYKINRQWKRLAGRCGIQRTYQGNVDFEIWGDDRLLWQARKVIAGGAVTYDVDVSTINVLKLIVTDGGNGNSGDWGVWIEPTLLR